MEISGLCALAATAQTVFIDFNITAGFFVSFLFLISFSFRCQSNCCLQNQFSKTKFTDIK